MNKQPVKTVRFYSGEDRHALHRPNRQVDAQQSIRDVLDIIGIAVLGFLLLVVVGLIFVF